MADGQKPLSTFEQRMLALLLEKLRPMLDAAFERAKAKLREDLGPEGVTGAGKLGAGIDKLLREGLPPIPPKVTAYLAGAVALLGFVGLYQRTKS